MLIQLFFANFSNSVLASFIFKIASDFEFSKSLELFTSFSTTFSPSFHIFTFFELTFSIKLSASFETSFTHFSALLTASLSRFLINFSQFQDLVFDFQIKSQICLNTNHFAIWLALNGFCRISAAHHNCPAIHDNHFPEFLWFIK